jgi:hypothetical protein
LAARKGDVAAAYDCAQWYAFGVVLEKSREAASDWLRFAAERGCPLAIDAYLKDFLADDANDPLLLRAVVMGSQVARCIQAVGFVGTDPAAAYRVFAESKHCLQGPLWQAMCLQLGFGVAQDLPRALSMFREYKPVVQKGPAGSEVTLFVEQEAEMFVKEARDAVFIAGVLHGVSAPRTANAQYWDDAVGLVEAVTFLLPAVQ